MARARRPLLLLAALVFGLLLLAGTARPALASCGGTTQVGNTSELNLAISAFNAASSPCTFTIEFTGPVI